MSAERDKGVERDTRAPKPCCNRLSDGSWCLAPEGHASDPDTSWVSAFQAANPGAMVCNGKSFEYPRGSYKPPGVFVRREAEKSKP